MAIKPVDHNTMIPKTVELSSTKHIENLKNRNIVEGGFIQQERILDRRKNKVLDVGKSSSSRINKDSNSKEHNESKDKKRKRQNRSSKKNSSLRSTGNRIDIRI